MNMDDVKAILLSRAAQLSARGLTYGLVALGAHIHAAQTLTPDSSLQTVAVCLIGAGLTFMWDHIAHYWQQK